VDQTRLSVCKPKGNIKRLKKNMKRSFHSGRGSSEDHGTVSFILLGGRL
jgi:hypothetical protein